MPAKSPQKLWKVFEFVVRLILLTVTFILARVVFSKAIPQYYESTISPNYSYGPWSWLLICISSFLLLAGLELLFFSLSYKLLHFFKIKTSNRVHGIRNDAHIALLLILISLFSATLQFYNYNTFSDSSFKYRWVSTLFQEKEWTWESTQLVYISHDFDAYYDDGVRKEAVTFSVILQKNDKTLSLTVPLLHSDPEEAKELAKIIIAHNIPIKIVSATNTFVQTEGHPAQKVFISTLYEYIQQQKSKDAQ